MQPLKIGVVTLGAPSTEEDDFYLMFQNKQGNYSKQELRKPAKPQHRGGIWQFEPKKHAASGRKNLSPDGFQPPPLMAGIAGWFSQLLLRLLPCALLAYVSSSL